MANSQNIQTGVVLNFSVKVNGNVIPDQYQVLSIRVEKKVNRISIARLVILDGHMATGNFEASSSANFVPGNEISMEAGYDSVSKVIFKGIITQQSIRINDASGSTLEVDCMDTAVKMTIGRKSNIFTQQKDSDIINSIIAEYTGLTARVSATETVWPIQVQNDATDWDFILSLADANGLIVNTQDGVIYVAGPDANTSAVLKLTYGVNINELNVQLDAVNQLKQVTATAWDFKNQALDSAQASVGNFGGAGNISSGKLSDVIGLPDYRLQTTAPLEHEALKNQAKAQLLKSEYARITGTVKFNGSNNLEPGKIITLEGVGDRFNGNHFVSGVIHTLSDGNWFTEASLGLSPEWMTEKQNLIPPQASGNKPGPKGLYNGTVISIMNDPENQFRILVNVPVLDLRGAGIWARLSNFYATSGAGAFFLPEIGDEVVLGFLQEDPRYPVILGSMYSGHKSPYQGVEPNDTNQVKAFVSRSGISITFDDAEKILTITTPAKNTITFSDKAQEISIKDQNGNSIQMTQDGIDIKSQKNINLSAAQKISMKAMQGIEIQSPGGDVDISGLNITETAAVQLSGNGASKTTLTSGGQLTINGAMVMIN